MKKSQFYPLRYLCFTIVFFCLISCGGSDSEIILPAPPPEIPETPNPPVIEKPFVIDGKSLEYAGLISSTKLKDIITTLASDEFEGRSPKLVSVAKTQDYLAEYLERINISKGNDNTSYIQKCHYDYAIFNNIVGVIEGSELKDEYILLCAHFDHLGINEKSEVFYGADDNASGVSALLEIAEKMMIASNEGYKPRRSVIFLFTTGEEVGFIGSYCYAFAPLFPLINTKACLNVDMIGRIDNDYLAKGNNYSYIIHEFQSSKSMDLLAQSRKVNEQSFNMKLDTLSRNYLYRRTDAKEFSRKGIPTIGFTSGLHDDYHTPEDKVEFIDFEGLTKRTKFIFLLTWHLANREE